MKTRSLDLKNLMSYPDGFDIIKVTTLIADAVLETGMIVSVTVVDADDSALPAGTEAEDVITITEETILVGDDAVKLIGYERDYGCIMFANQPTFANDITSVIVAGEGKNMSVFNAITDPLTIMGYFNKIQIPLLSTDMTVIAYK